MTDNRKPMEVRDWLDEIKAQGGAKSPHPMPESYVYFMRNENTQLIKIGVSRAIKNRQQALAAIEKAPIHYLGRIKGDEQEEKALHKRFAEFRVTGEWFVPSDDLENFIRLYADTSYPAERLPKRITDPSVVKNFVVFRGTEEFEAIAKMLGVDPEKVGSLFSIDFTLKVEKK